MYKVMLVDDEVWIRKSLKKMIEDTDLPIKVVCEAKNASEALQLINNIDIDIVITDMKMPESNGILLMDKINTNYKHIKVVVISGYSDFEYMKKAISIRAIDYLLKPVTINVLYSTLNKVISCIEEEKQTCAYKKEILSINKKKKEIFLQNISNSRILNSDNIKNKAIKFKIPFFYNSYSIIIFAFKNLYEVAKKTFYGNIELLINNIENIIYDYIENNELGHIFKTDDKTKICILFQSSDQNYIKEKISTITSSINVNININTITGISLPFNNLSNINQYFMQAYKALYNNPINSNQSYCFYIKNTTQKDFVKIFDKDIKVLSRALISKNTYEIKNCFSRILEVAKSQETVTLNDIHKLYINIIVEIKSALDTLKLHDVENIIPYMNIENTNKVLSFLEFEKNINTISNNIVKIIDSIKSSDIQSIINDVKTYIDEHYNEDISLVTIACKYHFEPTYFSKMFKSVMKIGFIEYLISVRLEKACDFLINSNLKINDISIMVGYENQRYFSQIFKKFSGVTPTQYRLLHCKNKNHI